MLTPATINEACTSVGVAKYGKPIGLDEKIKVDLIVIGSVAVDPRTGARLGKGEVRVLLTSVVIFFHFLPLCSLTQFNEHARFCICYFMSLEASVLAKRNNTDT